jgi:hypothetical protein
MDNVVAIAGRLALVQHEYNGLIAANELEQLTEQQQQRCTQLSESLSSLNQQLENAKGDLVVAAPAPASEAPNEIVGAIRDLVMALHSSNDRHANPASMFSLLHEMQKRAKLPEVNGNAPAALISYLTEVSKFLSMPLIKGEPQHAINSIIAWGWKGDAGLFWSSMTEAEQQQMITTLEPAAFVVYFRDQHFPLAVVETCVDQFVKIAQFREERLGAYILRVKEMRRILLLLGENFDDAMVYRFYHSGLTAETKRFLAPGPKIDEDGLKVYFERAFKFDVDSHGVVAPSATARSSTVALVDAWMAALDKEIGDDSANYVGNNQRRNVPWRSGDRNDKGEHPLCFKCAKRHAGGFAQCHAVAVSCDKCKKKDHLTQFHDNYVRVTAYNARFAKNAGTGVVSGSN